MNRRCKPLALVSGAKGFTLIEMMITVAVLAILSAIALPAYTDYVKRGKVSEAFELLTSQAMAMEQAFQDRRTYVPPALPTPAPCNTPASGKYFTVACASTSATAYTVRATANTGSGVDGAIYTLTEKGVRATVGVPAGWTLPSTPNCWANARSGSCQ